MPARRELSFLLVSCWGAGAVPGPLFSVYRELCYEFNFSFAFFSAVEPPRYNWAIMACCWWAFYWAADWRFVNT